MVTKPDRTSSLPSLPASDVKKRGWRGVMRTVQAEGTVVITNHARPEAVIVPAGEYEKLLDRLHQQDTLVTSELEALRQRFDERLASLRACDTGSRLRSVMRGGVRLRGRVKAGTGS